MSDTIQPGSVVQLKSGGPLLTVSTISDGIASVCWFAEGQLKHADIRTDVLQLSATRFS